MSESSQRLAAWFDAALDLPPAERAAFVLRVTAEAPELRTELQALLAADAGAAARALEALTPTAAAPLAPGTLVAGRYRIVSVLGEGGMGTVYAAEQLQPPRPVALKCLRAGFAAPAALQRFAREAELLGRLHHPGIAQIFEAGSTDGPEPQPFFAMELVRGPDLLTYSVTLPLRARLELFVMVCEAVQHAHAAGIVHRDLKPANVLVDCAGGTAQPKVLDFGVARPLDVDATLLTRSHEILGTLAYLAPEQLGSGAAVEPRTDVWSLGVLLYQLISGRLPFELAGLSLVAAARLVQDHEPVALDQILPSVRGDIATIVQTCLAKEPARRYADAGALAADLQRHLASEPITARPASAFYRLSRFTRRHRALVGGLLATILALAAGLGVSLHFLRGELAQRARAEQHAGELRELVREVVFEVETKLANVPGATEARRQLVAAGLRYAANLLADAGDDPRLLTEVGGAYLKLALVLGDPSRANLGDLPGALTALGEAEAALQRADRLGADFATIDALHRCALLSAELARAQSRTDDRLAALARTRDLAQRMRDHGRAADAALAFERAAADLGRLQFETGRYREAIDNFTIYADGQRQRLAAGDESARGNLLVIERNTANALAALGEDDPARARFTAGVALAEAAPRSATPGLRDRQLADMLREFAGHHCKRERYGEALPLVERARAIYRELPAEANDVADRRRRALLDFLLADCLLGLARPAEAAPPLAAYEAEAAALLALSPRNRGRAHDAMLGALLAMRVHGSTGDGDAVVAAYARALPHGDALVAAEPSAAVFREDLARAHRHAGEAFLRVRQADPARASTWLERAITAHTAEAAALAAILVRGMQLAWVPERLRTVQALLEKLRGT